MDLLLFRKRSHTHTHTHPNAPIRIINNNSNISKWSFVCFSLMSNNNNYIISVESEKLTNENAMSVSPPFQHFDCGMS